MDTLISMSFGTKIRTAVFWVEIHMNMDKYVRVGISAIEQPRRTLIIVETTGPIQIQVNIYTYTKG